MIGIPFEAFLNNRRTSLAGKKTRQTVSPMGHGLCSKAGLVLYSVPVKYLKPLKLTRFPRDPNFGNQPLTDCEKGGAKWSKNDLEGSNTTAL